MIESEEERACRKALGLGQEYDACLRMKQIHCGWLPRGSEGVVQNETGAVGGAQTILSLANPI